MKKIVKHLPVIFSGLASIGVVATGILSVRAEAKRKEQGERKLKNYILPISVGVATIGCIIASKQSSDLLYSTLLTSYIAANKTHQHYVNKNIELNGKEKHKEVINAVHVEEAQDPEISVDIFLTPTSLDFEDPSEEEFRLFYEPISKRYFKSTKDRVIQAEYHLNRNLMIRGWCSLNEFYDLLGIEKTDEGEILGWNNLEDVYWVDFNNGQLITDEGVKALVIDYVIGPEPGYDENI